MEEAALSVNRPLSLNQPQFYCCFDCFQDTTSEKALHVTDV